MQRKNLQLTGILVLLIGAIISFQFTDREIDNLGVDKTGFQLGDQQEITDVYLKSEKVDNHFSFQNGRWLVNDNFLLDQSMRNVFFSVLSKVEVRKPVVNNEQDSIATILRNKGIKVGITFGDELIKEYWVGGNRTEEITWMMDTEKAVPYQIHIPGYQSYIAGIYGVPTRDWRSRFILNVNFALITKIEMDYSDSELDLELIYNKNFFTITGVNADSTKIANFLDQVAYLQADQYLEEDELPELHREALNANSVYTTLRITKSSGEVIEVKFYERPENSSYITARLDDNTVCLISYERVKGIFQLSSQFK
jgi:hypothetical protein